MLKLRFAFWFVSSLGLLFISSEISAKPQNPVQSPSAPKNIQELSDDIDYVVQRTSLDSSSMSYEELSFLRDRVGVLKRAADQLANKVKRGSPDEAILRASQEKLALATGKMASLRGNFSDEENEVGSVGLSDSAKARVHLLLHENLDKRLDDLRESLKASLKTDEAPEGGGRSSHPVIYDERRMSRVVIRDLRKELANLNSKWTADQKAQAESRIQQEIEPLFKQIEAKAGPQQEPDLPQEKSPLQAYVEATSTTITKPTADYLYANGHGIDTANGVPLTASASISSSTALPNGQREGLEATSKSAKDAYCLQTGVCD